MPIKNKLPKKYAHLSVPVGILTTAGPTLSATQPLVSGEVSNDVFDSFLTKVGAPKS